MSGTNPVHPLGRRHLHVIWLGVVVLIALIAGLLLRSAWQRVYQITSPTMADTLLVGDYVTVDNGAYRVNPPHRSDIVLMEYPFQFLGGKMQWLSQIFSGLVTRTPPERLVVVRRIVGMPGETVAITNNQVIVDGVALKEPYRRGEAPENVSAVEIPPGFHYVLCDNRALGPDSRELVRLSRNCCGGGWEPSCGRRYRRAARCPGAAGSCVRRGGMSFPLALIHPIPGGSACAMVRCCAIGGMRARSSGSRRGNRCAGIGWARGWGSSIVGRDLQVVPGLA